MVKITGYRILSLVLILAIMAVCIPTMSYAAEGNTGTEAALRNAVSSSGSGDVILSADIRLTTMLVIMRNLTLDLNGHVLTIAFPNESATTYALRLSYGGSGRSLTILDSAGNGNGKLIVSNSSNNSNSAGNAIGGSGGTLIIKSGIVEAYGGKSCAGISVSNVIIDGGTVTARGGSNAAGIGGGFNGAGVNVTINGGTVTARGGSVAGGAGIGGGSHGAGGTTTITGGEIHAYGSGEFVGGAGIGGGPNGNGRITTITGGTVEAIAGCTANEDGNGPAAAIGKGGKSRLTNPTNGTVSITGTYDYWLNEHCRAPDTKTGTGTFSSTNPFPYRDSYQYIKLAPPTPTYRVRFLDWNNSVLKSETVDRGSPATAPANPNNRPGWHFDSWDPSNFSNIVNDLDVKAIYKINQYTVRFLDWNNSVLKTGTVDHGSPATAPANPNNRPGWHFVRWDPSNFSNIVNNLDVKAIYEINTYTVRFLDWDDAVLKTEAVDHGSPATAPANPNNRPGGYFVSWDPSDFSAIVDDLDVKAIYEINTYTLSFDPGEGVFPDGSDDPIYMNADCETAIDDKMPDEPIRRGYGFDGWFDNDDNKVDSETIVTGDINAKARYAPINYEVVFGANGGTGTMDNQMFVYGVAQDLNTNDFSRTNYSFSGWAETETGPVKYQNSQSVVNLTTVEGETIKLFAIWKEDQSPIVPPGPPNPPLPGEPEPVEEIEDTPIPLSIFVSDHVAYIIGYPNGNIQPGATITRAEVATVFFRLLEDRLRMENWKQENVFPDVSSSNWFNNAISVMSSMSIVNGYEDGTFKPNSAITRAELATIVARFGRAMNMKGDNEYRFTDISGHWAQEDIIFAALIGWVNGYPDWTFKPNQPISRAEFMTLVNRMLERIPQTLDDLLPDEMVTWPDNTNTEAWFYLAVQEATNSHEPGSKDELITRLMFKYEFWSKMLENPDWALLEKEWAEKYLVSQK